MAHRITDAEAMAAQSRIREINGIYGRGRTPAELAELVRLNSVIMEYSNQSDDDVFALPDDLKSSTNVTSPTQIPPPQLKIDRDNAALDEWFNEPPAQKKPSSGRFRDNAAFGDIFMGPSENVADKLTPRPLQKPPSHVVDRDQGLLGLFGDSEPDESFELTPDANRPNDNRGSFDRSAQPIPVSQNQPTPTLPSPTSSGGAWSNVVRGANAIPVAQDQTPTTLPQSQGAGSAWSNVVRAANALPLAEDNQPPTLPQPQGAGSAWSNVVRAANALPLAEAGKEGTAGDVIPLAEDLKSGDTYGFAGSKKPSRQSGGGGNEDGPWALESTLKTNLEAILENIRVINGERPPKNPAHGQQPSRSKDADTDKGEDKKQKTDYQRDLEAYEKENKRRQQQAERESHYDQMAGEASPGGGSGRNLANFGRKIYGIGKKLRNRMRGGMSPPNKDHYDQTTGTKLGQSGKPVARPVKGGAGAGGKSSGGGASGAGKAAAGGAGGGSPAGMVAALALGQGGNDSGGSSPAQKIASLGTAALEAGKAVYDFARAQEAEIRRLSNLGVGQAVGIAQLDVDRQLRDIKTARETGDSSQSLTESISKFEDKLQPIEALLTNIANTLGGRLLDLASNVLQAVEPIVETMTELYNSLPSWIRGEKINQREEIPWQMIERIAKESEKAHLPKWPEGPANSPRYNG